MFQTFTPREYLKIDIANNYGLDKDDWNDRIRWFDTHEHQLHELVASADEPALFYAGIKAWEDVQAGRPIGYLISLDATSSGLQLLAALTGDRKASGLCNVIDATGHREDAYTGIYEMMLDTIQDSAKITRDDTKQAIMTALYCSTAMPKKVFGEGQLLDIFYETMNSAAPAAWELKDAFQAMWDPEAIINSWILPDNFHVHIKVMAQVKDTVNFLNQPFEIYYNQNIPTSEGRSLGANCIHSIDGMIVRELTRRCDYDPALIGSIDRITQSNAMGVQRLTNDDELVITLWDHYNQSGYLSARILQHLNADNIGHVNKTVIRELIDSLPKKPFKVVSIHDCFRVLPTYGNDLRYQYNLQLQLIAKSNMLGWLISQIIGKTVHIGKLDPNLYIEIIDTNYALS